MAGRTLVDQTDQLKLFFIVATDLIVKNDEIAMMFIAWMILRIGQTAADSIRFFHIGF